MLLLVTVLACSGPVSQTRRPVFDETDAEATTDEETTEGTEGTEAPEGPCPSEMVEIEDFCIDRYEAHILDWSPYEVPEQGEGLVAASAYEAIPQGYINEVTAAEACENAGKRLCVLDEWMRACQGPDETTYPYGNTYDPDACNTTRSQHPIISLFGSDADFGGTQLNDPRVNQQEDTVDPSGTNPACVTAEGVYDMHGNLHEWIDDENGTFKGGFYMDAVINGNGCNYTTSAHNVYHHDYSTGFRCCAEPDADR